MNELLLTPDTRTLLSSLVGEPLRAVHADPVEMVATFDRGDLVCTLTDRSAASQNGIDELLWAEIRWQEAGPRPGSRMAAVPDGAIVTGVYAARTMVFFTDHVAYGAPYRTAWTLRTLWKGVAALFRRTPEAALEATATGMLAGAVGGHSEIAVNPDDTQTWSQVPDEYLNRVDAGVVLELNNDLCLPAFSTWNSSFLPIDGTELELRRWDALREEFGAGYAFERIQPD